MELSARRSALVGRLRHRKTREREGLFLVEGIRAAAEAVAAAASPRPGGDRPDLRFAVAAPRVRELGGGDELLEDLRKAGVEIAEVDDGTMEGLADTETPQGILLVCAEPRGPVADLLPGGDAGAGLLLLDGVQDPGNVGTLVRAAAAFGLSGVVALEGTVDPWNPKAVRAAAGSLFRVRVRTARWDDVGPRLAEAGPRLLVADAGGTDVARVEPAGPWALAVGNEGRGVRPALRRAAAQAVAVPMRGGTESLNAGVAGAILLYALTRPSSPSPGAS